MNPGTAPSAAPGRGIPAWIFALGGFMLLMLGANILMVRLASSGHRDLVRQDYYEASLDQDGALARAMRSDAPGMDIALFRDDSTVRVEAASESLRQAVCRVRLYRPDNGGEDRRLELGTPQDREKAGRIVWQTAAPALREGYWVALVEWSEAGKPTMEKSFRIFVAR